MLYDLTDNEVELLNNILIEFRCREGIGLEKAMYKIYCKLNGIRYSNTDGSGKSFVALRHQAFSEMFTKTPERKIRNAEVLCKKIINSTI